MKFNEYLNLIVTCNRKYIYLNFIQYNELGRTILDLDVHFDGFNVNM